MARLIEDVPPSAKKTNHHDSEKREERTLGMKEGNRKQTVIPISPRFARRKPNLPNSPVEAPSSQMDELGKVKN